jgi:hypothetical protein
MDPETRVSYRRFSTLKIFNIIGLLLNVSITKKKKKYMKSIQGLMYYSFKKFKVKAIYDYFIDKLKGAKLRLMRKILGFKFIFFLMCYILLKKNLRLSSVFLISNKFMIIKRLYYLAFTYRYNLS